MEHNLCTTERVIRYCLGLAIFALGITFNSWLGLIGLVPILTAAFSWCPAYKVLGFSTCKGKSCESDESGESPKD